MRRRWLLPLLPHMMAVYACGGGSGTTPDAPTSADAAGIDASTDAALPPPSRDLDLLFVIDNSGSMGEEQTALTNSFQTRFTTVLEDRFGGLPNLHIGIVSSNMGVGGFDIVGCAGDGDGGRLQNAARTACTPPSGYYIEDIELPDGTRQRNYTGAIGDTYACIAKLGTDGCGFEQHLASMKRALDGTNPESAGFLRPDAWLAVVFVADEDDCSVDDPAMFDPAQTEIADPLGPLSSFRCTEFGVMCDGAPLPRAAGSYSACTPRTGAYVADPHGYVTFLKGLKADPSHVFVGAIVGVPQPFAVTTDGTGKPALSASCTSGAGEAAPAVRFAALLDEFPGRSARASICDTDTAAGLVTIMAALADAMGAPP